MLIICLLKFTISLPLLKITDDAVRHCDRLRASYAPLHSNMQGGVLNRAGALHNTSAV
jgi:hypothetical protein